MAEYSKQLAAGFITHFYGAIDKRLEEKTKAELLAYDVREGYDGLFVICKDDKLLYAFDKTMTPSAETGNFYELTGRNFIITDDVFNYDATKRNDYTIYLQPDINATTSYPAGLYRFDSVESRYKLLEGYEIREGDKIKLFNNIYSTNNVLDPAFDATTLISDIKTGADKGFYDRKYVAVENKHAVECFFVAATTDPAVAEHLEFIYNDKYYKRFATDLYGYTISNDYEIIDKMYDTSGTTPALIPGVKEKLYYLTTFQRVFISGVRYTRTPGLYGWNGTDYFKINDAFDEKTIKTTPGFGNKAMPARTVIGGYRDILRTGGVEFDQTFTTDADGAIINQTVTPEKVAMNIIVNKMERNKPVIFSLINSTAGNVFLEGELSIYPTASASAANSTFEVKGDDFYFKVVYTEAGEGAYSMTLNVTKEAGLIANTTYTFSINYTTVDYHYVNNRFIEMDNTTITDVNPLDKTIGPLHAKSAIEVATFPVTGILPETIYRLTAEITIGDKKYAPGLYVYDTTDAANPKWLSVGGSEVDEKTVLSTNAAGDLVPLHTKIGGWDETGNIGNLFESCNFVDSYSTGYVHFTSNKNDNIITEENASYVYIDNSRTGANITYVSGFDTETGPIYDTFNPTKMTFIGGDKTTHIYEYKFEGTDLENRNWTMKIDFANKKIILTTTDTNWPTYGHVVYDDMTFLYYKFDDIKHSVDSDYINIDSKTIIRVNDGEEFDHFETCIGGWKEEGIIDKVDSLGTSWGFGTTSGGMGSSITDTSKFIRGTTFHEGDLLIFEGKFTDGNSNILTFEYNSSSTTEYKYAFKGVSPLTTYSYIEIYTSSANNEYWSGSFNYPEGTYRTGTAASARAVFNTTVWHKIDSRYLNTDNISIYNTNPLDDSLSTLKSRAIITTASVSANNLTTDVIYNLTSSVYYEGKSYKAGLYRYDGISNLIPITNAAADQKTIVGNVISGDPLHTAVGGYKTTTTEIRYGGLDSYTFIEGPQEVTFPAVSYPENGDQITLYVHTTDGSGSWSRGTYNATTKQATLDNGGMTCYVDKTVSKYWKISFVKGMYVGKTCILDLYRKVDTPEEVLVYSDPHFIDKDNETIVLDNIDKLKAKSAIEISTFPVFALAATEVIYRTTTDQTIEGKSYPKGLYVCDKSDADNPKWISVGMAKLDEKTIRSTNDSGESVPVYTQIGGWKETNYTASIDYGTPLLSEFMYGDNYWDLTFDYTYGTKPSKDTDYIIVDYETADGNQYNGKLTRISIDENNAVYAESTGATPLCRFVNHLNNNTATLYFFANAYGDSLTKSGSISYVSEDIIHHVDSKYINIDNSTIKVNTEGKLMANYSYGTTLPASGTEGQVFFLYS